MGFGNQVCNFKVKSSIPIPRSDVGISAQISGSAICLRVNGFTCSLQLDRPLKGAQQNWQISMDSIPGKPAIASPPKIAIWLISRIEAFAVVGVIKLSGRFLPG